MADINPGSGASFPRDAAWTVYDGALYFTAHDPTNGAELRKYDGESVSLVADINPGLASSAAGASGLVEHEGALYFSAYDATRGFELRNYDGATGVVDTFDFLEGSSYARPVGVINGKLAITAVIDEDGDGSGDREAVLVAEGDPESVDDFTVLDDGSGTFASTGTGLFVFEGDQLLF